ncbi:MAG: PKD domain-containing protein [Planctomycetota bacterium]
MDATVAGTGTINVSHAFTVAGTYGVRIYVTDKDGATNSTVRSVSVTNGTFSVYEGNSLSLDPYSFGGVGDLGSNTWRIETFDGSYLWSGSGFEYLSWQDLIAEGINDGASAYRITNTWYVYVGLGNYAPQTATGTLTIRNTGPQGAIAGPSSVLQGELATITLSATDPSPVDAAAGFTYALDWNGDGINDETVHGPTGLALQHLFAAAGTYTVRLQTIDKDGGIDTDYLSVVVPVGDSIGGPYSVVEGDSLLLSGSLAADPLNGSYVYSWDLNGDNVFGDAVGALVSVDWATLESLGINDGPANRIIKLQVTDTVNSTTRTAATTLAVQNAAPTASVAGESLGVQGDPIQFTLSASDASSADQAANFTFDIDWDGDGNIDQTIAGVSGLQVDHAFASAGTFTIRVTATDKDGGTSAVFEHAVEILAVDFVVSEGGSLALDAGALDLGDGTIDNVAWDVNGDGIFGDALGASPTLNWAQLDALGMSDGSVGRSYSVQYDFTPTGGGPTTTETYTGMLAILNVAPAADVAGPNAAYVGQSVVFVLSAVDPAFADQSANFEFAIDWNGDGTVDETVTGASGMVVNHVFGAPGSIDVRVTATDKDGGKSSLVSHAVEVAFGVSLPSLQVAEGASLSLNGLAAGDNGSGNFLYAWDVNGDGVFTPDVSGATPTLTWSQLSAGITSGPTSRSTQLRVTYLPNGAAQTFTTSLQVTNTPPTISYISLEIIRPIGNYDPWTAGCFFQFEVHINEPSAADAAGSMSLQVDWDGNGSFDQTSSGTGLTRLIGQTYGSPGIYTVGFRVTDKDGGVSDIETETIFVTSYVVGTTGVTIDEGQSATFSVSIYHSPGYSPDPNLYDISWDINKDGVFGDATGPNPTLSWLQLQALGLGSGPYNEYFYVRVSGENQMNGASNRLIINNSAPSASISGPSSVGRGESALFTLSATDASSSDQAGNFMFDIDWNGDGIFDQTVVGLTGTQVSHAFDAVGPVQVGVRARDGDNGQSAVVNHSVQVVAYEVVGGSLRWYGTSGGDSVSFVQLSGSSVRIDETRLNGAMVANTYTVIGVTGIVEAHSQGGDDVVSAGLLTTTAARIEGGSGNDSLRGGDAGDTILGGSDNDTISGGRGYDNIDGGDGHDLLYGEYAAADGLPTNAASLGHDTIAGGSGHDTIYGDSDGGEGTSDTIDGGDGNDLIYADGSQGKKQAGDVVAGGFGNDTIYGDPDGGEGAADSISGDAGDDFLYAGKGNDTVHGGFGDDEIVGDYDGAEGGNDLLFGDEDNDFIQTGGGNDSADGGSGDDILIGGDGAEGAADTLIGGEGRDLLIGDGGVVNPQKAAAGIDHLEGGTGQDIVIAGYLWTTTSNPVDIRLIHQEWASARPLAERIGNISNTGSGAGVNGSSYLIAGTTVFNDKESPFSSALADDVFSGDDEDWLFVDEAEDTTPDASLDDLLVDLAPFDRPE